MDLSPYLDLKALASYSGLSVRTLRGFTSRLVHPLPSFRINQKILVRRSDFDQWVARYKQKPRVDVTAIVDDVMGGLTAAGARV